MIKRVLGFDVSSSCIGYAILEWDDETNKIQFIKCNYYKPIKNGNILERLANTKQKIMHIIQDAQPDYIAIEDIIQFMAKKTRASTIITLAVFNRMVGLCSFEYLGSSPKLYNVRSIRHSIKLSKEAPKKEDVPALTEKHLRIKFPYIYKKSGEIDIKSYDMSDAVAVALCHILKQIESKKK